MNTSQLPDIRFFNIEYLQMPYQGHGDFGTLNQSGHEGITDFFSYVCCACRFRQAQQMVFEVNPIRLWA